MLKNILKIEGADAVSKSNQKEVNGGKFVPTPLACSITCVHAPSGTECGPPHCEGVCTGNGGFYLR